MLNLIKKKEKRIFVQQPKIMRMWAKQFLLFPRRKKVFDQIKKLRGLVETKDSILFETTVLNENEAFLRTKDFKSPKERSVKKQCSTELDI